MSERPDEPFSLAEHLSVHASTPLQGHLGNELFAPVMFGDFGNSPAGFRTVLVVNNPSDKNVLEVEITYRDRDGIILPSQTQVMGIASKAMYIESSFLTNNGITDAIGSVQVEATDTSLVQEFSGATVYYAEELASPSLLETDPVVQLDDYVCSLQPLQPRNGLSTRSYFGPIPIRSQAGSSISDIATGLFPFVNVINPNPKENNLQVILSNSGGVISSVPVTLKPYGALQDVSPWTRAYSRYVAGAPDEDVVLSVISLSGLPVIGEMLTLDYDAVFSNPQGKGGQPSLNTRANLTSVTGTDVLLDRLVGPELVQSADMETVIPVANFSGSAATISAAYYDGSGGLIGIDTVSSVPSLGTALFALGSPDSPGFPTGVDRAWVSINSTEAGLLGWTKRGSGFQSTGRSYADLLSGGSLLGHEGWFDQNQQRNLSAPLVFEDGAVNPGYIAFVNDSGENIGVHSFTFYSLTGNGISSGASMAQVAGLGIFAGLATAWTTRTYQAPMITNPFFLLSGLVTHEGGRIRGISTIGGPPAGRLLIEGLPSYPGPGDLVP